MADEMHGAEQFYGQLGEYALGNTGSFDRMMDVAKTASSKGDHDAALYYIDRAFGVAGRRDDTAALQVGFNTSVELAPRMAQMGGIDPAVILCKMAHEQITRLPQQAEQNIARLKDAALPVVRQAIATPGQGPRAVFQLSAMLRTPDNSPAENAEVLAMHTSSAQELADQLQFNRARILLQGAHDVPADAQSTQALVAQTVRVGLLALDTENRISPSFFEMAAQTGTRGGAVAFAAAQYTQQPKNPAKLASLRQSVGLK